MDSNLSHSFIVFVNAPHILLPSEVSGTPSQFDSEPAVAAEAPDPNTALRGWWRFNKTRTEAEGLQTSISVIRGLLMAQRFDVRGIPFTTALSI